MRKLFVLSVLAVLVCFGECGLLSRLFGDSNNEISHCADADIHEYLDRVLAKVRAELPDPMRLPPRSTYLVELSDGVVWGLSNLTRLGEAQVTCDGNNIIVKSKITTDEIKGRYTWNKSKNNSGKEGYVVFISHDFQAETELEIERKEGEPTHPRLLRFEIKRFKNAKVEISGASYLGWALGELTTLFSGVFQRSIASAVQGPIQEALERQMEEIAIE